jgi:hypothetical protein
MRIGFDFDNTIVSYDSLFHTVAREQGHIPDGTPVNKNAVRDYLRAQGREPVWTEMQGYVYGARMNEAAAYPNAIAVIEALGKAGHELAIISHKTAKPYEGPAYDLHAAARGWINTHLLNAKGEPLIPAERIFFLETKPEKIAKIAELECDVFIDDLPEILLHEGFPAGTRRFLFAASPQSHAQWTHVADWQQFHSLMQAA